MNQSLIIVPTITILSKSDCLINKFSHIITIMILNNYITALPIYRKLEYEK